MKKAFEATKTAIALGLCLTGAGFGLFGCQNTAEGVSKDAAKDTAVVGNAADKAVDNTKMAADKAVDTTKAAGAQAGDALTLTPKVKNAIIADATLNDPKNLINVDTKDGVVYLKGHVQTNAMKKLAGDIASKTVAESGSKDKVMNQLTVASH